VEQSVAGVPEVFPGIEENVVVMISHLFPKEQVADRSPQELLGAFEAD
jgi:predicted Zn-dependent protease with MMP-like domain